MNLSPAWVETLRGAGWEADHWSRLGAATASDAEIPAHARASGAIVLTHDLDFGHLLTLTHADGPSVVQVRTADVTPGAIGALVIAAPRQANDALPFGDRHSGRPARRRPSA